MEVFMNVLASILAVLGYFLTWIFNKKKLLGYKRSLLFLGAILTVSLIWWEYYSQNAKASSLRNDITNITNQNKLLIGNSDSLKTKLSVMQQDIEQIHGKNQELASLLEPFRNTARNSYPGINDQLALQQLASDISKDISKMKPKLVFLGQTEPQIDSISGFLQTSYGFRSEPTHGLNDVQIEIRFDKRFVFITGGKRGDIVEGRGQLTPYPDSTGFKYYTRYLREGNYINITVTSKEPLNIVSITPLPK